MELKALDHLMQMRLLNEGSDRRLVVVQITDQDITDQINRRELGMGSLKDMSLNRLLEKLQKFQPRLIGLDLYRDFAPNTGESGLGARLLQPNVYTVCKVPETNNKGEKSNNGIDPPPGLPLARIGFSDFIADADKVVRRQLLTQNELEGTACRTAQSLSLLLARRYLELTPGQNSQYVNPLVTDANLQLGKTSFESLQPFTGGYQDVPLGGYQVMLNYRATGSHPRDIAKLFTLDDILSDRPSLEDIKDKIVLIGVTDQTGINDNWETPYGTLPGVIVQAHMVSQILSAAQNDRPLLKVLPQGVELLWIWGWAISGGLVVYFARTPRLLSISGSATLAGLYITCLCALSWGSLWLPLIPPVFAFSFTGLGVFYATRQLPSFSTLIPTNHAQNIIH
jgi:CHASE2 domain-containing sensor protein